MEEFLRIASITMIGQFPHGIDIHSRNLQWSLSDEDHIFIVTLANFIDEFKLKNTSKVTYIPFGTNNFGWIDFWASFPKIINQYKIDPEWFLFMEQDIWFHERPNPPTNKQIIRSFLPRGDYRNVLLNEKIIHDRVWEGAQIIHHSIVKNAINYGISFSFKKNTFLDKNRHLYETEFGGKISLSMYFNPDTMDEFNLYCAIIEKTTIEHDVKAIHLRGPESIHRLYPKIYSGATIAELEEIQKNIKYLDLILVASCYYMVGNWNDIKHLNLKENIKKEYRKLKTHSKKWLLLEEIKRLDYLLE